MDIASQSINNEIMIKELRFKADIENYTKVRNYCREVGKLILKDNNRVFEYLLCIDEIFINSIIHAYRKNNGNIDVKFILNEKYLITKIRDYGVGIPKTYTKKIIFTDDDILSESGRGLYIVNSLADKLEIKNCEDIGTEVSIYFERVR
ncbi:Anti-sigma regulatory factor (Ser/Thr protein kinase) [Caminicella sporogenes DSM 14501]|uniref:Anti-sigma regulatory factor (Ser/Thr protein kinase) n=1 Tax=Caminicella sporogenes DSM 14501 TaxID=1121266 RepID=A0A1M6NII8_9FIRM|nr:ATP-binding protein [Caminicella sporogenes]RKD22192.1 hypothetical protein BET04_06110 [Caminicella sporogenes]WIF95811.1 ATP-binding protein [Caminicella sporogenes]SHJ95444.1 Anti-sigma regulatory factor (Ser/Thr protein kinase) [Caminicella sporogenes DSM 14501]